MSSDQQKIQWLADLEDNTPLYLVGFEKDPTKSNKDEKGFREEFGVKIVRGVTVKRRTIDASMQSKAYAAGTEEDQFTVDIELDPRQYKEDLDKLVKTKFIEDIYSNDCQLVVKMPHAMKANHIEGLQILNAIRDTKTTRSTLPSWLEAVILGKDDEKSGNITLIKGGTKGIKDSLNDYISDKKDSRALNVAKNEIQLS